MGAFRDAYKMHNFNKIQQERDAYRAALLKLVQLKIGPKDSVYHREKPKAWQEAADLLGIDTVIFP